MPSEITFYDIYNAIFQDENLFSFHKSPNEKCPVGENIHNVLDNKLLEIKSCFDKELKSIKLSSITTKLDNLTKKQ